MHAPAPVMLAALLPAAAATWFSFRFAWWRRTVPYDTPRILMYHMISPPVRGLRFNKSGNYLERCEYV